MGDSEEPKWKSEVRGKIVELCADEKNAENFARVLFYLDEEDRLYNRDCQGIAPAWKTLRSALCSDKVFKAYAQRLAEDTKTAEKDPGFRRVMSDLYSQMMSAEDTPVSEDESQGFQVMRLADADIGTTTAFMGFSRAWSLLSAKDQAYMLELIPKLVANKQVATMVDEAVGLINKAGGNVVMVGLAALHLAYDVIINLKRWWNGEISGKRACKKIVDSFLTLSAGVGGGIGGAAVGSFLGPVGTVVGGVIGGIGASAAASALSDLLTQKLFGVPKSEALENAYNFLGVKMTASNVEINSKFRQLCLKYHPDKPGGSNEQFHFLQLNMATIKAARGEL